MFPPAADAPPRRPEWDRILSSAQKNDTAEIHRLIMEENVDPSHANVVAQTALHIACLWGNVESVEALLKYSADLHARNRVSGASPLHSAVQSSKEPAMNRVECAKLLIGAGADVHMKDFYDSTPIEALEAEAERVSLDNAYLTEMRKVLKSGDKQALVIIPFVEDCDLDGLTKCLETQVEVDERDKRTDKTALLVAIDMLISEDTEESQLRTISNMIQLLLEKNADANATAGKNVSNSAAKDSSSPMHIIGTELHAEADNDDSDTTATRKSCLKDVAASLYSCGAKVSTYTARLMHDAARRGHVQTVKFWIEKLGIDLNLKGRQGLTSMHFAARSGKIDMVKLLLSYKSEDGKQIADLSILDDRGKKAIEYAQINNKQEVVTLLQENE